MPRRVDNRELVTRFMDVEVFGLFGVPEARPLPSN
jgi:hypothetical protein